MTRVIVGVVLIAALVLAASGCGGGGEGDDGAAGQGGDPSLEDVKAAASENPSVSESCDSLEESVQVEGGTDIEQEVLVSCADGGLFRYTRYGSPELLGVHGLSNPTSVHFRSETVGITFYGSGGGLTGGESLADAEDQRISEEIANDVRERCDCGEVIPAATSE